MTKQWLLWVGMVAASISAQAAGQTVYEGRFEQVSVESGDESCAELFEPRDFTVKHFLVGPSRLTSVLFFQNDDRGGWLEGRRFVGRYDYREIYAEETVTSEDTRYEIVSRGILNSELILVDVSIVAYYTDDDRERCRVLGELSGFN